jgi:hypothetical protein
MASFFGIWHEGARGSLPFLVQNLCCAMMFVGGCLGCVTGSRDGVHRLHWNSGSAVIYLINTGLSTELVDLFPPANRQIECVGGLCLLVPGCVTFVCLPSAYCLSKTSQPPCTKHELTVVILW